MTASVWNQYLILLWNWVLGAQRRGAGGCGSGELNARVISAQNYERCFLFQTSQTADVQHAMMAIAVATRSVHWILFHSVPVANKADFIRLWKLHLMVLITDKNTQQTLTQRFGFCSLFWQVELKDFYAHKRFNSLRFWAQLCQNPCLWAPLSVCWLNGAVLSWKHIFKPLNDGCNITGVTDVQLWGRLNVLPNSLTRHWRRLIVKWTWKSGVGMCCVIKLQRFRVDYCDQPKSTPVQ